MSYWHYTCSHAAERIGDIGRLLPLNELVTAEALEALPKHAQARSGIIWLTDLDTPLADALGLTSRSLGCDRTEYRYRVESYQPLAYTAIRRDLPKLLRDELESARGAMPMHWYVAHTPVPVVYDPIPDFMPA